MRLLQYRRRARSSDRIARARLRLAAYRRASGIPGMHARGRYGWPVLVAGVLSLKGGVGKTTVTLGLASAAVHLGLDTLLVDLDPQINATATVAPDLDGAVDGRPRWSVAEVLDDPTARVIGRAVRESAWGEQLRVLPGSERTESHNHPDPGSKKLFRLATALAKVKPQPELVLIDCPPSLGPLIGRPYSRSGW